MRNAFKHSCSIKGSVSSSEQQGVARTTINVSFATKSIHLARNSVYLYRKAGVQYRGVVSYKELQFLFPCSTGLLASFTCAVTEGLRVARRFIGNFYKTPS